MYKIIGADGQQYGPVSADQIRQWIADNRVRPETLVQRQGAEEWKAANTYAEFADALTAKAAARAFSPPPLAGTTPKPDAEAMAAEILARDYRLEIGSCISRSWNLLMQHFWLMVGACFVLQLVQGAVPLLTGPCMGGFYFLLLKLIRGQRAEFGDGFAGFSQGLLQLFLCGLVRGFLILLGFFLCILPGIYLAVAWLFALPLIIDKKMDFWPAMELSRKVVCRHWWVFFGFALANILVGVLGWLACFIGIYVAVPVIYGAVAYAYEDIFRSAPANPPAGRS